MKVIIIPLNKGFLTVKNDQVEAGNTELLQSEVTKEAHQLLANISKLQQGNPMELVMELRPLGTTENTQTQSGTGLGYVLASVTSQTPDRPNNPISNGGNNSDKPIKR